MVGAVRNGRAGGHAEVNDPIMGQVDRLVGQIIIHDKTVLSPGIPGKITRRWMLCIFEEISNYTHRIFFVLKNKNNSKITISVNHWNEKMMKMPKKN